MKTGWLGENISAFQTLTRTLNYQFTEKQLLNHGRPFLCTPPLASLYELRRDRQDSIYCHGIGSRFDALNHIKQEATPIGWLHALYTAQDWLSLRPSDSARLCCAVEPSSYWDWGISDVVCHCLNEDLVQ
jgi:hypothetical protein